MRSRRANTLRLALCATVAASTVHGAAAAGFVGLSSAGETVLADCNPNKVAGNTRCKVSSLPGEAGFDLVASRSAPLIANDVRVGTLSERVWRHCTDKTLYIFGARVQLNTAVWNPSSGTAFNVNDLARRALPGKAVSVAYFLDGATKPLLHAGRTVQGLNEYDTPQPARDNSWVDFRVDANAAETAGPSSARSPWVLVKTRAPQGYALNDFGLRVLNADVEDVNDIYELFTVGYQPNGVPAGGGGDD